MDVFVAMPFGEPAQQAMDSLTSILARAGYAVRTASEGDSDPIARGVLDAIGQTDVFIADVSGSSPNVMYELGYAAAMGKSIILLVSTDALDRLPIDLASYRVLIYDPNNESALRKRLLQHLEDLQPHYVAR